MKHLHKKVRSSFDGSLPSSGFSQHMFSHRCFVFAQSFTMFRFTLAALLAFSFDVTKADEVAHCQNYNKHVTQALTVGSNFSEDDVITDDNTMPTPPDNIFPSDANSIFYRLTVDQVCKLTLQMGSCPATLFYEFTLFPSCTNQANALDTTVSDCSSLGSSGSISFLMADDETPPDFEYILRIRKYDEEGLVITNGKVTSGSIIPWTVGEVVVLNGVVKGVTGSCNGDPHFNRWHNDVRDTFHGECDLVFLHDEDVAGQPLTVHTRTTIEDSFSYVDAVAMKYGDDAIEFQHDAIYLNGAKVQDESEVVFGEGNKIVKVDDKKRKFVVDIQGKVAVNVASMKKFMSVSISGNSALVDSTGILGDYETGDMIGRHGQEFDNFEDFAFEWQVNPEDPQIFMDARHPQLPYERCRMPSMSAEARRRKLRGADRKLLEAATEACVKNHIPANVQSCIDDVMFTGELELAEAF